MAPARVGTTGTASKIGSGIVGARACGIETDSEIGRENEARYLEIGSESASEENARLNERVTEGKGGCASRAKWIAWAPPAHFRRATENGIWICATGSGFALGESGSGSDL
ncbi:hypothetical protein FRC08_013205 [Ceratobasidium sp. 394]|nr:hypothetical protein FRC08_013205 [Ceratobasidium sp. 394]